MKASSRPEAALIGLNILVVIGCIAWGASRLRPPPTVNATSGPAPASASTAAKIPPDIGADEIDAHPLFHRSRRPPLHAEPLPQTLESEPPTPPEGPPNLLGVASDAGRPAVLLEDPATSERKFVRAGQTFGRWTVSAILPRGVRLAEGERLIELVLLQRAADTPANAASAAPAP